MPLDLTNKFNGKYGGVPHLPVDTHQALVQTPYGRGMVIRTRKQEHTEDVMREIELSDWVKPATPTGPQKSSILYSTTKFPSVKPEIGDEVLTIYGRGRVLDIRAEQIVVRVSSWRLAGRSLVTCYLSPNAVQVVRPKKIHEMSVEEKVEHAMEFKEKATKAFAAKQYGHALELYARAVDTVRYVQHKANSSNELRSDLLVVMITCCNNAATCCLQLQEWDRAQKFGKNALILIDALYDKIGKSKIHDLLNREGVSDSQLFGTWKVKSCLVIARGLAEKHDTEEALTTLKTAVDVIATYKVEGDINFKQLEGQEKQVRKLYVVCKDRLKAERQKEKKRAIAMFGGSPSKEEKKDVEKKDTEKESPSSPRSETVSPDTKPQAVEEEVFDDMPPMKHIPMKKRVSFAQGSKPGSDSEDEDDESSLFGEHKEAIFIVAGVAIGTALTLMLLRRR
jgi:tetratricopeptide (TPR) repeat protein